jgi:hypothetical protein
MSGVANPPFSTERIKTIFHSRFAEEGHGGSIAKSWAAMKLSRNPIDCDHHGCSQ